MSDENGTTPGWEIGGRFYPVPTAFRLGDPILVAELTGITWTEFMERLDSDEEEGDPVVMLGMVGVAVWQANPRWTRAKAVAFVQAVNFTDLQSVGMDADEDAGDAGPPELAAPETGASISTESQPGSNGTPGFPLTSTSPPTSGAPVSTTGAPD